MDFDNQDYANKQALISKEFRVEFFQSLFSIENAYISNPSSKVIWSFRAKVAKFKFLRLIYLFAKKNLQRIRQSSRIRKMIKKNIQITSLDELPQILESPIRTKKPSIFLVVPYFLEMNGPDSHYGELMNIFLELGFKVNYVATESSSIGALGDSSYSKFHEINLIFPEDLSVLFVNNSIFVNCGSPWFYQNARILHGKNNLLIDYLFNHVGHTKNNIQIRDVLFHTVCQHQALTTVLSETDETNSQYSCIPIPIPDMNLELNARSNANVTPLWVGRLSPEKGVERLTKVAELYYSKNGYPVQVIGSGPLFSTLKRSVLNGTIDYLGPLSHQETVERIRNAGSVFNTSFIEGVSLVSLEALSVGTPVLSFDVGGMSDLLWHPGMTIWSDNKDLGGFVEKLTTISQKQIQVESFTIPANYKKEYQKAEWIKIINAMKKSMV